MVLKTAMNSFWNPHSWLPQNLTWADIVPNEKIQYTDHGDVYYSLPLAMIVFVIRYFLNKFCYAPLGVYLGITTPRQRIESPQPELERLYKANGKPGQKEMVAAADQVSMSEKQVAQWFRIRRKRDRPSALTKFCRSCFQLTIYTFLFSFGLILLWDTDWLWDIQACWDSYPHQSVSSGVWWYYIFNMALGCFRTVSHFFEDKRKDFWCLAIHHIAVICLLYLSWISNLTRIGMLALVLHDFADIFLEASKVAWYLKFKHVDALFVAFTLSWLVTRLGLFPFWIINNTLFLKDEILPIFPLSIFNGLFILILILHIFWTRLILKIVYKAILCGKVVGGDVRSSSEEDSEILGNESIQEKEIKKAQ